MRVDETLLFEAHGKGVAVGRQMRYFAGQGSISRVVFMPLLASVLVRSCRAFRSAGSARSLSRGAFEPSRRRHMASVVDDVISVGDVLVREAGVVVVRCDEADPLGSLESGAKVVASPSGADGTVVLYRSPLAIVALDDDEEEDEALGTESVLAERLSPDEEDSSAATLRTKASELMGREVNWQCEPLQGQSSSTLIFGDGLSQAEMQPIDEYLSTGLAGVDLLVPLGRGQSVLFCGEESSRDSCRTAASIALDSTAPTSSIIYASLDPNLPAQRPAGSASFRARRRSSPFAQECEAVLTANAALAAGAELMNQGVDAVVSLDTLEPLLSFWSRSTSLLADAYGLENANLGDDSECRSFFSSLLQRCGRRKSGGSLSVIAVVCADPERDSARKTYTVEDFEKIGTKASVIARLRLLVEKNLELTDELLDKIGVRPPDAALGISSGKRTRRSEAVEMLTSIVDAHVDVLSRPNAIVEVDPAASLQRVGLGSTNGADTRPPALRKLGVGHRLRLELAAAADATADQGPDAVAKKKALTWIRALTHVPGKTPPRLLSHLVVITMQVQKGHLDAYVDDDDYNLLLDRIEDALAYLRSNQEVADALDAVDETGDLDDAHRSTISKALDQFVEEK